MPNLYPGHKPSYGNGRLLLFLLIVVTFPCCLFAQPSISSVSPASGTVGTAITITGTNFNPAPSSNIVYIGTVQATVSSASATALTIAVPAGTSYQPITVTTGGLTASSSLPFITTFFDPNQFVASAFSERTDIRTGLGPQSIVSADLDGDGKPELIVVNGDDNTLCVYRNASTPGALSFILLTAYPMDPGDNPTGVAAGDLDGDGKTDLVVTNNGTSSIALFRNTSGPGSISLAASVHYPSIPPASPGDLALLSAAAIGDLNGDGKPEILIAATGTGVDAVSVYANTSSPGSFSFSPHLDQNLAPGTGPVAVVIADFNGDGKPDLATANANVGTVSLFKNTSVVNGAITFVRNPADLTAGNTPYGIATGDLDGDGKADLAVVNLSDNSISLFRNTGAGGALSFDPGIVYTLPVAGLPQSVGITDLDGDGKPDLAVTDLANGIVSVFQNTSGSGSLSAATGVNYSVGALPQYLTIADVDGDGMPDLVTSNNSDQSFTILRNKGSMGPVIRSFTPITGIAGTVVTITGTNFTGATAVSFGGVPATSYTAVTATRITATVGAGAAGAVEVTNPSGAGSLSGFSFGQTVPVITSFTPTSGASGALVSISGTGFNTASTITFGGVPAPSFIIVSDTLVTAVVGTGASGKVAVISPYGGDSLGVFTYSTTVPPPPVVLDITSFSPATGKTGDAVTIKGIHLSGTTSVSFGGIPAQSFDAESDSVIIAVVGTGASGQIVVIGANGIDSLTGFTYQAPPPLVYKINSFSPSSGSSGTNITITGSHFTGATVVSFGGIPAAAFSVTSDNSITAVLGPGGSGQVKVIGPTWQDSLAGFTFTQDTTHTAPPPVQPSSFELLQFSASPSSGQVLLQWSARNDKNITYYTVERGNDSMEFTVLVSLPPNVKDAGNHTYSYTDPSPQTGTNYYRLKIVDASSSVTYSHTIALQEASKTATRQLAVFPNPIKYGFTIVDLPATSRPSRLQVSDMMGKVIRTQDVGANIPQVRLDLSGVIRGTYKLIWSDGVSYAYQTILIL